jgi:hypothetical protein
MIVSRNSTRKTFDSLVNNDSFVPSKFHVIMNLKLETHWINKIRYLHSFKLTKKARSMNLDTNFIGIHFTIHQTSPQLYEAAFSPQKNM